VDKKEMDPIGIGKPYRLFALLLSQPSRIRKHAAVLGKVGFQRPIGVLGIDVRNREHLHRGFVLVRQVLQSWRHSNLPPAALSAPDFSSALHDYHQPAVQRPQSPVSTTAMAP